MIPQLACFTFLDKLGNIILGSVIAVAFVICFVIMAKYKHSRKILTYILCVATLMIGLASSINFIRMITAKSYENGSIDITNKFSQEEYNIKNLAITFYPTENAQSFVFENDSVKTDDFNGEKYNYILKINNHYITDCEINAGSISAKMNLELNDSLGNVTYSGTMNILISFYSDRTNLKLSVKTTTDAQAFTKYFQDNTFSLEVIKLL